MALTTISISALVRLKAERDAYEEDRDREAAAATMWCEHSMGWAADHRALVEGLRREIKRLKRVAEVLRRSTNPEDHIAAKENAASAVFLEALLPTSKEPSGG